MRLFKMLAVLFILPVNAAVADTTSPVLLLSGINPFNLEVNNPYIEPGYSALDDEDGDITGSVIVAGTVDHREPGTYMLTYSVSDKAGNTAVATRTVNVTDNTPPEIELIGSPVEYWKSYDPPWWDAGVTASDNHRVERIETGGTLDPASFLISGNYFRTYQAFDPSGNASKIIYRFLFTVVGLQDNSPEASVFPIPAAGTVNFTTVSRYQTITIINLKGKLIYTGLVPGNEFSLNLPGMQEGTYFYCLMGINGETATGKIILKY